MRCIKRIRHRHEEHDEEAQPDAAAALDVAWDVDTTRVRRGLYGTSVLAQSLRAQRGATGSRGANQVGDDETFLFSRVHAELP